MNSMDSSGEVKVDFHVSGGYDFEKFIFYEQFHKLRKSFLTRSLAREASYSHSL